MIKNFKSPAEIDLYFHFDDWECRRYFEDLRWKNGVTSPYTGSKNVKHIGYYDNYVCLDTDRAFSTLTGTIFANSKTGLLSWFKVLWLNWQYPDSNSVYIAEQLGMNQKTVWLMLKKIKEAESSLY